MPPPVLSPKTPNGGRSLARAGWSIISSPKLPSSPEALYNPGPPPEFNALGAQLVLQVCSAWTRKYQFTIVQNGFDGQYSFHYECIFSIPSNDFPVPMIVISARFALIVPSVGADPRLLYSFEEGDLRHEWTLERVGYSGQWQASRDEQGHSLGANRFQAYLDSVVREKESVRDIGVDLITPFEVSRLQKPPAYSQASSESGSDDAESSQANNEIDEALAAAREASKQGSDVDSGMGRVMIEAMRAAGLYCDKVEPPSSLAELLASIFDAADEENAGELPHYEVAKLLGATLPGFGLELWDIHLLMTSAQENDSGYIECKPFIQAAPEIINALRKRRIGYVSRGLPGVEVPQEAIKHCFTSEAEATSAMLFKTFEQLASDDPSSTKWEVKPTEEVVHHGTRKSVCASQASSLFKKEEPEVQELVGIKRRLCQDIIGSLPERLSPQEMMRLMQMLPEDEDGFVMIDELGDYLEHLRTDAMLNALVESDVLSLRTHLVLRFRRLGLGEDRKLPVWNIKEALLQADQVCLTRLQIHVLLSLALPDAFGQVSIDDFLGMCCVVIPHMFDAKDFVETAERLVVEHAEAARRAENEEMMALGASRVGQAGQDGEETAGKVEVDLETVERTLQQILNLNDDQHRSPPALPPEQIFSIFAINEREVQATQLSSFELTGFSAEMQIDAEGLVNYVDHIKKWMPIIFEQRKNSLLSRYLQEDTTEALGLEKPNLAKLEEMFPLLPSNSAAKTGVRSRRSSRRKSGTKADFGADVTAFHVSDSVKHGDDDDRHGSKTCTAHGTDRRVSKAPGLSARERSKQALSSRRASGGVCPKIKDPPPGRGFGRRKAKCAEAAAEAEAQAHLNTTH